MKRKDLIRFVERNLQAFGFKQGQWLWQPRGCQLCLVIGGTLKQISLKTTMSKKALIFEMGRLAGLCEALGMIRSENQSQPDQGKLARAAVDRLSARPNGHAPDGFGNLASLAAQAA